MNKNDLLAIMVFAIDRDLMSQSVEEVWTQFTTYMDKYMQYYDCVEEEVVFDILHEASLGIESGERSYGKNDEAILEAVKSFMK